MSYIGLDKFGKFFQLIKENGGIRSSLYRLYRESDLKTGTLIGIDQMGNKYYENNEYFLGRNRWVIYSPSVGSDFEGSAIPPEWFGWMHHKTDIPPTKGKHVAYSFIDNNPSNNATGTADAYMPYSTTKPKIHAWQPTKSQ